MRSRPVPSRSTAEWSTGAAARSVSEGAPCRQFDHRTQTCAARPARARPWPPPGGPCSDDRLATSTRPAYPRRGAAAAGSRPSVRPGPDRPGAATSGGRARHVAAPRVADRPAQRRPALLDRVLGGPPALVVVQLAGPDGRAGAVAQRPAAPAALGGRPGGGDCGLGVQHQLLVGPAGPHGGGCLPVRDGLPALRGLPARAAHPAGPAAGGRDVPRRVRGRRPGGGHRGRRGPPLTGTGARRGPPVRRRGPGGESHRLHAGRRDRGRHDPDHGRGTSPAVAAGAAGRRCAVALGHAAHRVPGRRDRGAARRGRRAGGPVLAPG